VTDLGQCLVTGGGGFIGSHVVEQLCRRGAEVRALARYNGRGDTGWLDELDADCRDEVEIVLGDVRDPDQMRRLVTGCDTVFHLAALIGIPYSYVSPRQNLDTNAGGTLNLLEAARAAGVRRFVHTSTSEVYGTAQYVPIDEAHPLVGQSPYAATKIAADQLTMSYALSFDLPAVIVRPFNTFGPRQSMRAVIPTIATQALWSGSIRLGALDTTRDFTFVRDTASGFVRAAQADDDVIGRTFNLGVGKEITIGDLAELIRDVVGRDVPIEQEDARMRPVGSEVDRLCSNPERALAALGWQPEHDLRTGIELTVEWIRARGPRGSVEQFAI
jgi:NAD dependent epimerase/dehydratase